MAIGWKITDIKGLSWAMLKGKGAKAYAIGVTTTRSCGCGPLVLFSGKRDAMKLLAEDSRLFRAEYVESKDVGVWNPKAYIHPSKETSVDVRHAHPGSVYADQITLLEEVK